MDAIKTIGMSICITIIVTSIFSMLLPHTKLDKVIKFSISLFFLTGIISPFFTTELKFNLDIDDIVPEQSAVQLDQTMQNQFISVAQTNLENAVKRMLKNDGINAIKVEVYINKLDKDNISISKLMVYIENDTKASSKKIEDLVKKEVGLVPTIIII